MTCLRMHSEMCIQMNLPTWQVSFLERFFLRLLQGWNEHVS